ncbi:MAG: hypothetical protein WC464_00965 [Bdellovibrionales bacterium]
MSSRSDLSGLVVLIGIGIAIWAVSTIIGKIKDSIEKRAKALCEQEIRAIRDPLMRQIEEHRQKTQAELDVRMSFYQNLKQSFSDEYIKGRKWLANFIAEAERPIDDAEYKSLIYKKHPARSAAEVVKEAKKEKRDAIERLKFLEYQLASFKEYFPVLEEYEEIILNERVGLIAGGDINGIDENADRTILFVTDEEYKKLPEAQKNQLALDRYLKRDKSKWEIGRFYERYVGYQYESEGWNVDFFGATKGFEDMGRDLICKKDGSIHIVQAKCWSADKVIREKHIFQLFGTTLCYEMESNLPFGTVKPVFATTTKLSDVASLAAQRLGIAVRSLALKTDYPLIKCNINQGNKIYHLPFDQQYDRVRISNKGEYYVQTVAEAERKGFRRAKRYFASR